MAECCATFRGYRNARSPYPKTAHEILAPGGGIPRYGSEEWHSEQWAAMVFEAEQVFEAERRRKADG
jgi:hypothetical protein